MSMVEVTEQAAGIWYAVEIKGTSARSASELDAWCTDNLGQGIIGVKQLPDISKLIALGPDEFRWGMFYGRIFFRYREDMLMFMLRWS
jgi:hypothetical protein